MRRRHQQPIVCDEISQHGHNGLHGLSKAEGEEAPKNGGGSCFAVGANADGAHASAQPINCSNTHKDTDTLQVNSADEDQSCARTASTTTADSTSASTTASTTASTADNNAEEVKEKNAQAYAHKHEHAVSTSTAAAAPKPTEPSRQAGESNLPLAGSIRAEPQLPSCRVVPPKQSCMIVKSSDESIHSLGLSHHRPSGKRAGTCMCWRGQHQQQHAHTHTHTKQGRRDTGMTASATTCSADLSRDTYMDDDLSVSFSTIEVREFPVIIGDNPSCAMGPPLSIDWDPDCELSIDIEEFEHYRNGQGHDCCRRRTGEELRLDPDQRKYMALNAGSSNHDIANAVRQVGRDRRARRRSIHNNLSKPFYAFDVAKESATRKLKRLILGQKKDSALYDEYTRMHKESRRRELANMTILEEEAAAAEAEEGFTPVSNAASANANTCTNANAAAIVIQEDSTHRGGTHFYECGGAEGQATNQRRRANAAA